MPIVRSTLAPPEGRSTSAPTCALDQPCLQRGGRGRASRSAAKRKRRGAQHVQSAGGGGTARAGEGPEGARAVREGAGAVRGGRGGPRTRAPIALDSVAVANALPRRGEAQHGELVLVVEPAVAGKLNALRVDRVPGAAEGVRKSLELRLAPVRRREPVDVEAPGVGAERADRGDAAGVREQHRRLRHERPACRRPPARRGPLAAGAGRASPGGSARACIGGGGIGRRLGGGRGREPQDTREGRRREARGERSEANARPGGTEARDERSEANARPGPPRRRPP